VWFGAVAAAAVLGALGAWFADVNRDPNAVTQDFSEFTWSWSRLLQTGVLIPASMVAAIPTSAALLVLFFHQREARNRERDETLPLARLLALAWVLSVACYMIVGVSNPRYAMPAGVLLAPLAAWAIRACWNARRESVLARVAIIGHPLIQAGIMLALGVAWVMHDSNRPRHEAGRVAGAEIAAHLPDGSVVWANDLVEARPDALLYAAEIARREGREVYPRWRKGDMLKLAVPAAAGGRDAFLLLREDEESGELSRYARAVEAGDLTPVASGEIVKYRWVLLHVRPPAASAPRPDHLPAE
jgi:hypothetical protein